MTKFDFTTALARADALAAEAAAERDAHKARRALAMYKALERKVSP